MDLGLYYYGARYYDPDIGQFISIDPLRGKYPGWGTYVYTLQNPLKYIDPDGEEPNQAQMAISSSAAANHFSLVSDPRTTYRSGGAGYNSRYLGLSGGRTVDMLHFTAAAQVSFAARVVTGSSTVGFGTSQGAGLLIEVLQKGSSNVGQNASAFSSEDLLSNLLGGAFGAVVNPLSDTKSQAADFLNSVGGLTVEEFKKTYPDAWNNMAKSEQEALQKYLEENKKGENKKEETNENGKKKADEN